RRLEAAIGAVEIVKLRLRCKRHQGEDRRKRGATAAHASYHSAISAVMRSACGVLALALAACSADGSSFELHRASLANLPKPGILFDAPPPDIVVRRGGPSGELLVGPTVPALPDDAVDTAIGPGLRNWLTPIERRQLAEASQRAVLGITGT